MYEPEQRLNRKEAALYLTRMGLKTSPATLAKHASLSIGPGFEYLGRWPVYPIKELDIYLEGIRLAAGTGTRRRRGLSRTAPLPTDLYKGQDVENKPQRELTPEETEAWLKEE